MKVYADYNGEVPAGVVVVKEGPITRIYFDYEHITKTIDGETIEQLVCENVDITGAIEKKCLVPKRRSNVWLRRRRKVLR